MQLPRLRLGLRSMMALVALAGVALAGADQTLRHLRLRRAAVVLGLREKQLRDGRITVDRYISGSRDLMAAQVAVGWSRRSRMSAFRQHLDRATRALGAEMEADKLTVCSWPSADIYYAEQMIEEDRELFRRMAGGE